MLLLQPQEPKGLLQSLHLLFRSLSQSQVIGGMCTPDDLFLAGGPEARLSIFTDGFEHIQAWLFSVLLALLQHTLVDERSHSLQDLSRRVPIEGADCLHRLQGAAPCEYREPLEEPLLSSI